MRRGDRFLMMGRGDRFFLGGEGAIACPEINLSTKLENQLAENEYPLLMLPLFYALPLQ
jgi:hypothetical protein